MNVDTGMHGYRGASRSAMRRISCISVVPPCSVAFRALRTSGNHSIKFMLVDNRLERLSSLLPRASGASFMQSLLDIAAAQQQQQGQQQPKPSGATVCVHGLTFHPPGTEAPLLSDINMTLPANSLNLVIGRRLVYPPIIVHVCMYDPLSCMIHCR